MLDQRLVRDNPEAITSALGRRGKAVDLTRLQLIAQQQRDLEETRSSLQADGNRIGKEVGKRKLVSMLAENPNTELTLELARQPVQPTAGEPGSSARVCSRCSARA